MVKPNPSKQKKKPQPENRKQRLDKNIVLCSCSWALWLSENPALDRKHSCGREERRVRGPRVEKWVTKASDSRDPRTQQSVAGEEVRLGHLCLFGLHFRFIWDRQIPLYLFGTRRPLLYVRD